MSFRPTELYVHLLSLHAYSLGHEKVLERYTSDPILFWTTSVRKRILLVIYWPKQCHAVLHKNLLTLCIKTSIFQYCWDVILILDLISAISVNLTTLYVEYSISIMMYPSFFDFKVFFQKKKFLQISIWIWKQGVQPLRLHGFKSLNQFFRFSPIDSTFACFIYCSYVSAGMSLLWWR
jgi:hypothetical protein